MDVLWLTIYLYGRYNSGAIIAGGSKVTLKTVLDISLIITSVTLILSVILQSKGAGLGGLTGADTGGVFTARRGVEKALFWATIVLSVLFFILAIASVIVSR